MNPEDQNPEKKKILKKKKSESIITPLLKA